MNSLRYIVSVVALVLGGACTACFAQPVFEDHGQEIDPSGIVAVLGSFGDRTVGGGGSEGYVPVLGVVVMPDSGGGRIWIDHSRSDAPFLFAPGSWMQQSVFVSRAALVQSALYVRPQDPDLWIRRVDLDH